MRRALVIAVSAALFATLFGSFAASAATNPGVAFHSTDAAVGADQGGDVHVRSIWQRCRKLMGDDELGATAHEKCVQIFKRWCNAHPRARHCRPPVPPPRCRVIDRIVDRRCVPDPCRITDRLTDVQCVPPCPTDQVRDRLCPPDPCPTTDHVADRLCIPPCPTLSTTVIRPCLPPECLTGDAASGWLCLPPECLTADTVADRVCGPCVADDGVVKCVPVPTERPLERPDVEPTDRPLERVEPRSNDRIADQKLDYHTDRVGNDVYLRAVNADS